MLINKSTFRSKFGLNGYLPLDFAEFSMTGQLTGSDKTGPVKISNVSFKFLY